MQNRRRYSVINGAFLLAVSALSVKLIGMIYKIPLTNLIGAVGRGYFSTAYNIFTPIYAISMAGLPIAMSRMISQYMALGKYRHVKSILRVSVKCFTVTGIIGFLLLVALAYPYSKYIARTPNAVFSILAISPSIFFCCIISAFRGYYEGQSNMYPTAVSQLIEAISKMALGLAAAYAVMEAALNEFKNSGTVFGNTVQEGEEIMSRIYPYTAAGAIAGVTVGTFISMIYLILRHRIKGESFDKNDLFISPEPPKDKEIFYGMLKFALPVMIGTLLLNLVNIIDSATIQNRLAYAISTDSELIRNVCNMPADVRTADISAYLYGCYNSAMDFKNLIPTVTSSLGISALPALASAWELKNRQKTENTVSMVTRLTVFISLPAGFGMALLAKQILGLVYSGSQADIVNSAAPVLAIYSAAIPLFSLSMPVISMLHAIGDMTTPIKSLLIGSTVKIALNMIFVGNPYFNINGAIFGTMASTLIIVVFNFAVLMRKTGVKLNITAVFLKPLISAIVSAAAARLSFELLSKIISEKPATVISLPISAVIYVIMTFLIRGIYANDIKMFSFGEKIAKILENRKIMG